MRSPAVLLLLLLLLCRHAGGHIRQASVAQSEALNSPLGALDVERVFCTLHLVAVACCVFLSHRQREAYVITYVAHYDAADITHVSQILIIVIRPSRE